MRWARRALTLPLYSALAAAYIGSAPLWLPLAYCVDVVLGARKRAPRTRGLTFFALFVWSLLPPEHQSRPQVFTDRTVHQPQRHSLDESHARNDGRYRPA